MEGVARPPSPRLGYVDVRINSAEVEPVDRGVDERADPAMGEAEDAFEVASGREVVAGDEVVAVLSGVHVRPEQAEQRVVGRQFVARYDGERPPGPQVDPAEMADQREVRRGRAQRQPARQRPVGIGRGTRASVAIDPNCRKAPVAGGRLEAHDRAQRTQSGVVLEFVEHPQVPGEAAAALGGHVAGEGARQGEHTEIRPLEFRRSPASPLDARVLGLPPFEVMPAVEL